MLLRPICQFLREVWSELRRECIVGFSFFEQINKLLVGTTDAEKGWIGCSNSYCPRECLQGELILGHSTSEGWACDPWLHQIILIGVTLTLFSWWTTSCLESKKSRVIEGATTGRYALQSATAGPADRADFSSPFPAIHGANRREVPEAIPAAQVGSRQPHEGLHKSGPSVRHQHCLLFRLWLPKA